MIQKPKSKTLECKYCGTEVHGCSPTATGIVCSECVIELYWHPEDAPKKKSVGYPKGWKFMKQFVHKDGTVYFKGIEQQNLKGKLTPTVIEPKEPKKKISKQEKDELIRSLGKEITTLKSKLMFETKKGKRAEYARLLSRANRTLKKLI